MFAQLVKALAAHFGPSPEPVCLIGNVMFEDKEIDAVLLKSDVLLVIEMKDYAAQFVFPKIPSGTPTRSKSRAAPIATRTLKSAPTRLPFSIS